jgi:hypothetical protein
MREAPRLRNSRGRRDWCPARVSRRAAWKTVPPASVLRCGVGWGFSQDSQRLLDDSQGSGRIAQILRRHRSLRTPGPFYCYRVSRVSEVDAIRTPAQALASPRPGSALTLARAAAHGASTRPCRARFTCSGKRAEGAAAALARSTRTPHRLTLEGEQSVTGDRQTPTNAAPSSGPSPRARFPARRQWERDAPCAAATARDQ